MRLIRQKIFVSLENLWLNENAPKRSIGNKVRLTAKNTLNNVGVAKQRLLHPFTPISLEDKKNIIKSTNSTLGFTKDLATKPTETITKGIASTVKDTIKAPATELTARAVGASGAIASGNPLAYSVGMEAGAREVINGVKPLKKTLGAVDSIVGSEKLANKINPEAVGKAGRVIDDAAKSGVKGITRLAKRLYRR